MNTFSLAWLLRGSTITSETTRDSTRETTALTLCLVLPSRQAVADETDAVGRAEHVVLRHR